MTFLQRRTNCIRAAYTKMISKIGFGLALGVVLTLWANNSRASLPEVVKYIQDKYHRKITIFDLSGKTQLQDIQAVLVCLLQPEDHLNSSVIQLKSRPSLKQISELSLHEHFDIVVLAGGIAKLANRFEYLAALCELGDYFVFEIENKMADQIPNFLNQISAEIVPVTKEKSSKYNCYVVRNRQPILLKGWITNTDFQLITSHHYRIVNKLNSTVNIPSGISLYAFRYLNGIFPSVNELKNSIKLSKYGGFVALPQNAFLQGDKVVWCKGPDNVRMLPEEGVTSILNGLHIDQMNEYHSYCVKEYKRLILPK